MITLFYKRQGGKIMEEQGKELRDKITEMIKGIDDLWILNQIYQVIIHIIKED